MDCMICDFNFKNKKSKSLHIKNKHCLSILEYSMQYENFKIPKCVICSSNARYKKSMKFYKTCGSDNCKSRIHKNKIISDLTKEKISKSRKKFLKENPDRHVWKRSSKFISVPCEHVKSILIENDIEFKEEVSVSTYKHYSVDILITGKNLIIEINGNQHYDKNGNLKEYYQNRHNFIKDLGFNIIELPYYHAFNEKKILSLVNSYSNKSVIIPFFKKEKKESKYGTIEKYQRIRKKNMRRIQKK